VCKHGRWSSDNISTIEVVRKFPMRRTLKLDSPLRALSVAASPLLQKLVSVLGYADEQGGKTVNMAQRTAQTSTIVSFDAAPLAKMCILQAHPVNSAKTDW